ncbi:unnamed protein product [Soboliphyme baturini]|uniref:Uncharacterized protein n=1 Tax=Soboliphyme baturini TaxID=241478 RepID=A0A183J492_9BILA|nr:unnamed protein product [Soboliphyme baturini]
MAGSCLIRSVTMLLMYVVLGHKPFHFVADKAVS